MIGDIEITGAIEGDLRCNKEPKVVAYLDQLGLNAVINLCDDFFLFPGILPSANDVIVPSEQLPIYLRVFGFLAIQIEADEHATGSLGPTVSSKMNSLGHFILHETTHFKGITNGM